MTAFSVGQPRFVEPDDQMIAIFRTQFQKFVQRQRHVESETRPEPLDTFGHHRTGLIGQADLP